MGPATSRHYQFVSAIKSGDVIDIKVTRPDKWTYKKSIRFDENDWDRLVKENNSHMLIQCDENSWPEFIPHKWGVGTGFPDFEVTIEWKKKTCTFFTEEWCSGSSHLPLNSVPCPTFQFYVYEDGIRVGPQPLKGFLWGRYKDKRTVIPWKECVDFGNDVQIDHTADGVNAKFKITEQ